MLRLLWRLPLLLIHIGVGIPLVLLSFIPGVRNGSVGNMRLHQWAHRAWSRGLLRVMGCRLQVSGQLPERAGLVVANHITWLDIVVLHAVWPIWLVAKAEIRAWPLVGTLAHLAGTLFIQRGSEVSRKRIGRRMTALLKRGEFVGIFPEGGIRPGRGVKHFHARLFAPALRANVPAIPVSIRYDRGGDLHDAMVFGPGQNFFGNLFRSLQQAPYEARVVIGAPVRGTAGQRSQFARACYDVVESSYES
ncbi:MAG: lysophospholipid acyltransferase family protein [Pseudomonadota bacterium]